MHEMAITQSVVDAVCDHAAGRRVQASRWRSVRCARSFPTLCSSASSWPPRAPWPTVPAWISNVQPGAARCRSCGEHFELTDLILLCPCGSADVEVLAGRELRILSMEVS